MRFEVIVGCFMPRPCLHTTRLFLDGQSHPKILGKGNESNGCDSDSPHWGHIMNINV